MSLSPCGIPTNIHLTKVAWSPTKGWTSPFANTTRTLLRTTSPIPTRCNHGCTERNSYFVGPQARYNLNFDKLSPVAQEAARSAGLGPVCRNPFQSIVVRSVEMVYACDEALRIIEQYVMPDQPAVNVEPRVSTGYGCTEAPRGICYHRYRLDDRGIIVDAKIVPPTSQNQKTIESDLWQFVQTRLLLPKDKLQWQCEQAVRNYDPCISCATHFLKLHIETE